MAHERDVAPDLEEFHGVLAPSALGRFRIIQVPVALADGQMLDALLAAIPEVDQPTRDEHRREHGGEDAQAVDHGKPLMGPEPKASSARPAISVVMLASRMVAQACS